jgi:hypothetical protein
MASSPASAALARDVYLIMGKEAPQGPFPPALEALKRSYRRRAQECHPDQAAERGIDPAILAGRFRRVREAYDRILLALEEESNPCSRQGPMAGNGFRSATRNFREGSARAGAWKPPHTGPKDFTSHQSSDTRHNQAGQHQGYERPRAARLYHSGGIPQAKLRLGQYLYYARLIDWQGLISALALQLSERPKLGELGMACGRLALQDVLDVLRLRLPGELFGEAALRMGRLDAQDLWALLGRQRLLGLPLGHFLVKGGYLSQARLEAAVEALKRHNLEVSRFEAQA